MMMRLAGEAAGGLGSYGMIIYLVAIVAVFYFILIRPQRKEQKNQAARLASLEIGDSIRTSSGFFGTIIDISEEGNTVIVEFGNNKNCRIPMLKEAIVEVEKPEDAVKPVEEDSKKKK
ncbi:MAG: preprotein translocase subunit YajC [Lachnospiraceae bacterium]|nr:preprotein translocase subunit YajC [Lachnospiraceae bacterium]